MKNKYKGIALLLLILSIGSCFISYRTFLSFVQAKTFTLHFNTREFTKVDKEFYDNLITDLPNLSATCIPIKAMKASYLSYKENPTNEEINLAKKYLKEAIKDNPYIKIPESELSKIYFLEKEKDSAIYYGKIAFEGLKKNPVHFAHYAAALASVGDTATIRKVYEEMDYKDFLIDKIYLTAMTEIMDQDKTKRITESVEYLSSDDDQYKVNIYILNHGRENVIKAMEINKEAEADFSKKDYLNAAKKFEKAINFNPSESAFYENAGNSYMKIGDQKNAQKYLKKAIDSFNTKKGKSEYLYGLSKLLSGDNREGCYYLAISHNNFKYNLAYSVYQKFCK
ncbi:MAG: tetratricopeptide repeat protein [Flavobacteriaceae bacterium]